MIKSNRKTVKPRDRSVTTRERILDAALRLIARLGLHAVTYRAVAEESGEPLGVLTYHFPSRRALIRAGCELNLRRTRERARERHAAYDRSGSKKERPGVDDVARALQAFIDPVSAAERESLIADFELALEITRDPTLMDEFADARKETLQLAVELVADTGSDAPFDDAKLIIAAIEGLALDRLSAPPTSKSAAELERLTRRLAQKFLS